MSTQSDADKLKATYGNKSNLPDSKQVLKDTGIPLARYIFALELLGWG